MTCCSRRWRQDGALSGHPGPKEAGVIGGPLSRSEGELAINAFFLFSILVSRTRANNILPSHRRLKFSREEKLSRYYKIIVLCDVNRFIRQYSPSRITSIDTLSLYRL